jgi:hypothetical protein
MEKPAQDEKENGEEEEWVGPLPSEATDATEPPTKKVKVLLHEKLFIDK